MYKKVIILIMLLFLSGCSMYYANSMQLEEVISLNIKADNELYNTNNKGYRYYLPNGFNLYEDDDYNQVLTSKGRKYYMYVDIVSYYYENEMTSEHELDDYKYYTFNEGDKNGYLRITKSEENVGYFFVELCYNYAIIETEVEESEISYAVSRAINILCSIKYNRVIVENVIGESDFEQSESLYEVPKPEKEGTGKNILEYIGDTNDDDDETEEEKNLEKAED